MLAVVLTATMVRARSETALSAANQILAAPFTACIDESDCSGLGSGYACFQGCGEHRALKLMYCIE